MVTLPDAPTKATATKTASSMALAIFPDSVLVQRVKCVCVCVEWENVCGEWRTSLAPSGLIYNQE